MKLVDRVKQGEEMGNKRFNTFSCELLKSLLLGIIGFLYTLWSSVKHLEYLTSGLDHRCSQ